jgi:hypothetical protein
MDRSRAFVIRSAWDMGFVLTFGGQETWHPTFADAAGDLGLVSERSGNVFDAAYRSEIDARVRRHARVSC